MNRRKRTGQLIALDGRAAKAKLDDLTDDDPAVIYRAACRGGGAPAERERERERVLVL